MSRSPLYERVETVLPRDIADGSLPPETQLPSEDGLVERFEVSRTTVQKAIQNLVERGLVEVRRGNGTFVTQPKITQELTELTGFVEDMQAAGRTPTARLLDKRIVAAHEAVARHLALHLGCWWSGFSVSAWRHRLDAVTGPTTLDSDVPAAFS